MLRKFRLFASTLRAVAFVAPVAVVTPVVAVSVAACSSSSGSSENPGDSPNGGDTGTGGLGSSSGGSGNPFGGSSGNAGSLNGSGGGANAGTGGASTGGPSGTTGGAGNAGTGNAGTGNAGTGNAGTGNAGGGNAGGGNAGSSGSGGTVAGSGGTSGGGNVVHVDNPYAGTKGYVNSEWQAKANAEPGGSKVSSTPTAVWLDRIAAIAGTPNSQSNGAMGLRDHLDAALTQGAGYIQFVIYDLPGRDCSALASNGELGPTDLPKYESDYIDPIAAIMGDPKYSAIHIVNVIEPDSLPNLLTNTDVAECATMKSNGNYVNGVAYALQKLGAIPNVYNYIDAGHHGWLGWDSNFGPTADLFHQVGMMAGLSTISGFITNTANYSALTEPFFNINTTVNGTSVKQSKWVDYNSYVDELTYAQALRTKLVSEGFDSSIGMLIDTSRNGWGGSARPTAASTSTDVDTFVDGSRIDRRIQAGNWCNQTGAGLGERPTASPADGIDAYVWIKPPGESDGSSTMIANSDGKGFDRMCDPTYTGNERNGNNLTGALSNAPLSGAWFSAQFQQLMQNADPPL